MLCVIWYHLHNLKNVKNTNGGVLLFVMLQGFTKNNIPPGVSLQVFKIIQMIPNRSNRLIWQRCCQNNDSCDAWKWYLFQAFMTHFLTLMWMGFLGVCFEVEGGGQISPHCLKLVRTMLETSNLARTYTPICRFRRYTF